MNDCQSYGKTISGIWVVKIKQRKANNHIIRVEWTKSENKHQSKSERKNQCDGVQRNQSLCKN